MTQESASQGRCSAERGAGAVSYTEADVRPFTSDDVRAAVDALVANAYYGDVEELDRDDLEEIVRIVLTSAYLRGRLLPEDTRTEEWWGIRQSPERTVMNVGGGSGSEWLARRSAESTGAQLMKRVDRYFADGSLWRGGWVPVPAEPQDPSGVSRGT